MKFTKMCGVGNDFIIINNIEEKIAHKDFSHISKRLCTRALSLGADGAIFIEEGSKGCDYKIHFYNNDGSLGEMCGNGSRCAARYAFEHSIAPEKQKIETDSGIIFAERISKRMYKIQLNEHYKIDLDMVLDTTKGSQSLSYVELGEPPLPHSIVQIPKLREIKKQELRALAKELRFHNAFKKGSNINFYDIDESGIYLLSYERGIEDFTLACGTGTASLISVLYQKHLLSSTENVKVNMPGGELYISLGIKDENICAIYLIGDTNIIATGEITDEELIM